MQLYNAKGIAFLLDPKDSVQAYEEAGKMNKQESQYEKGMKALASMGHVQKLTAIEGKTLRLKIFYEICFQLNFSENVYYFTNV